MNSAPLAKMLPPASHEDRELLATAYLGFKDTILGTSLLILWPCKDQHFVAHQINP